MSPHAIEQQVNLYQPILGAERRLFSAQTIALALAVMAVSLLGISSFASRRTGQVEHAVDALEKRQALTLAMAEHAGQSARPQATQAELDAESQRLSTDITARQRALDVVHRGSIAPGTGFAARLAALGQRQIEGLWLTAISIGIGPGGLSMRGGTLHAALVPEYLAALTGEAALAGVHFERLAMRDAPADEAPAQLIFELDAPGVALRDAKEAAKDGAQDLGAPR